MMSVTFGPSAPLWQQQQQQQQVHKVHRVPNTPGETSIQDEKKKRAVESSARISKPTKQPPWLKSLRKRVSRWP